MFNETVETVYAYLRISFCQDAPPQLKDGRRHYIRLDQANAEEADGGLAGFGQREGGGERFGGDEAGLNTTTDGGSNGFFVAPAIRFFLNPL